MKEVAPKNIKNESNPENKVGVEKSFNRNTHQDSEGEFTDGGNELINPFSKYENKYKEFYRQQWMKNHKSWFAEGEEVPSSGKFFKEIVASGKVKSPDDWFKLSLKDKREINDRAFGPIDFNKSDNWSNSIRRGYQILGISGDGFTGFLKDKFGRTEEEKAMAEEAIYDFRFKRCRFVSTPMSRIPATLEEEKQFEAMNSTDMNSTKARAWMEGMNVEQGLKDEIIKLYEEKEKAE